MSGELKCACALLCDLLYWSLATGLLLIVCDDAFNISSTDCTVTVEQHMYIQYIYIYSKSLAAPWQCGCDEPFSQSLKLRLNTFVQCDLLLPKHKMWTWRLTMTNAFHEKNCDNQSQGRLTENVLRCVFLEPVIIITLSPLQSVVLNHHVRLVWLASLTSVRVTQMNSPLETLTVHSHYIPAL